eukprot:2248427-Alexandrium_andersonii.AAC.1
MRMRTATSRNEEVKQYAQLPDPARLLLSFGPHRSFPRLPGRLLPPGTSAAPWGVALPPGPPQLAPPARARGASWGGPGGLRGGEGEGGRSRDRGGLPSGAQACLQAHCGACSFQLREGR